MQNLKQKMYPLFYKQNWAGNIPSQLQSNHSLSINEDLQQQEEGKQSSINPQSVGNNKSRKNRKNYSEGVYKENMAAALNFARKNPDESKSNIAKKFNVDRKALVERLNGFVEEQGRVGRKSILTKDQEQDLVKHLIVMAGIGFGYDVMQAQILIRCVLKLDDVEVSDPWFQGFLGRHPELSRRRAQTFNKLRMASLSSELIQEYFDLLKTAFDKCEALSDGSKLTSNRIFGGDEVGFNSMSNQGYILTAKGEKHPISLTDSYQVHISVMAFGAANGWAGPECFLLPGVRQKTKFNKEAEKYFPEAKIIMTPKGYMTESAFLQWTGFFVEKIQMIRGDPKNWCLLILDGHSSHSYNPEAFKLLNNHNIIALSLPSHATNLLQVHDVSVFGPLKRAYRQVQSEWLKKNGLNLKIENFPEILSPAWSQANSANNLRSGFRTTGIWPLNLNWVSENKLKLKQDCKTAIEVFDKICQRNISTSNNGFCGLIERINYLNLDFPKQKADTSSNFNSILIQLYAKSEAHLKALRETTMDKKTNQIGEEHAKAKILNDKKRIQKLEEVKKKKVAKKKLRLEGLKLNQIKKKE